MSRGRRAATFLMVLAATGLIGWLDFESGPDLSLTVFYLIPVVAAGWWLGTGAGFASAVTAMLAWLAADLPYHAADVSVELWNAVSRLVVFVALSALTARLREDRDALQSLNERLQLLLADEAALARTDALTRLPNVRSFLETVRVECARSRRDGKAVSLAYLDLDDFKVTNDTLGHAAGDELLRRVAGVLRGSIRDTDAVARLGGDEFAILLWDADPLAAELVMERVLESLRAIPPDASAGPVAASIGVICCERPPDDAEELLRAADAAMYAAKSGGKNRVVMGGAAAAPLRA
jgi:diguanylate cyclase (GGDEF)-like protein